MADELERVLSAVTDLVATLTPTPADLPALAPPRLGGWSGLAGGAAADRLRSVAPWAAENIDRLLALEAQALLVTPGSTLLHGDLYPFNMMLTADRVYFVDWPHAWVGASHIDLVTLLSSTGLSGFDPQLLVERHPLTRDLDPLQIDVTLALHAGFLLRVACTVGPETDSTMVDMMVALATGSLRLLESRQ
ncbi:phosphotransferase [Phytohabitans kaempferiae]|uniref:Phosphotransferase n=1 Tax=Phytohabitans kaempferiae TaxID=1620943 RepID=A0ABV6MA23_9ACTN